ncbi:uncharacterized protein LOC112509747 [Cynara cardunculus var. scolymus]|uniref:Uncharacterized protein n=1 Tax=Cynara cardunculus var. scolymus TaxID=59895 RepID=A0A103YCU7_CYNCS|nr:uncharacterized protein LOC112509747 [Cynara cardunculus var. scolymus]KVI06741.1 hypothetical protein Ccrd_014904 [Cynara cardunculus var. scolymus]
MSIITTCLASQKTFTTCNLLSDSSQRFYANPISGFPITGKSRTLLSMTSTTTVRWDTMIVYADDKHDGSPPPPPSSSTWKNWVIGCLMTFIVPSITTKGGPIKVFMNKLDHLFDTAEEISDIVEAVADKVDKVAEKLSDDMPEGSKLKNTLEFIEQVAERLEKDAETAGDLIDKVQEIQEKIEDILEPILDESEESEEEEEEDRKCRLREKLKQIEKHKHKNDHKHK